MNKLPRSKKIPISVIIITKNEEKNIIDCLESVKWAQEIIIVDSGSNDRTKQISQEYTHNFFFHKWQGFGVQKQIALDYATFDWVLSIDADERVTKELKIEIIESINKKDFDGYYIPRLSNYFGKFIKHSGWFPDYTVRLVRRNKAAFSKDMVHEKIKISGKLGKLENYLIHFPYESFGHHMKKINSYSELGAIQLKKKNYKISWPLIYLKAVSRFFRVIILKFGLFDGWRGFLIAITSSISCYQKYSKFKKLK